MDEEESILNEFLVECAEGIERLDQEFVALEKSPDDSALIGSIFRTVHTIKGTCGFLGLPKLENIAHGAENILSVMRDKEMEVTSDGITILLDAVDVIKEILTHIEEQGSEPEKDYSPMRQRLDAFLAGGGSTNEAEASPTIAAEKEETVEKEDVEEKALSDLSQEELIAQITAEMEEAKAREEADKAAKANPVPSGAAASTPLPSSPQGAPSPPADVKIEKKPVAAATPSGKKHRSLAESSIRVDVELLDKLINMVGELVLARNQLLQQVREGNGSSSSDRNNGTVQQLNLITTELQDTVMKTRMQQIRNVWDKFPRVIRDLARSNGKEIDVVMEGAETELDKTLLEAIKDPMTHIVRNAADHGVEAPDVRTKNGKPAKGTLFLKAYHEGGQINIEISDDGAGIDVEKVKAKAVKSGLISEETADRMSDRDGLALIFRAGLSTAEKITNVSGRGVGMDVVKTNIEKIGGTVDMSSRLGEGTKMRIKIPLTLAIIPALMVTSGDEPFAIPQASLVELVRVDEGNSHQVEVIHGADFYRLRGELLPLVSLSRILNLEERSRTTEDLESAGINIVVLKAGDHSFGLVVDHVNDSEEIVVKPLSRHLKGLSYLAGATIMGDGRVALILDAVGVAQNGGLLGGEGHEVERVTHQQEETAAGEKENMILFSVGENDRHAILLSQVARLEDFAINDIEQSGGQEVIQYRGEILPLVRLGDTLGVMPCEESGEKIPAIVYSSGGKSIGLVVGRIIDIVEARMNLHAPPAEKVGLKGSLVIDGLTTDLLDLDLLIDCAVPGWLEEASV